MSGGLLLCEWHRRPWWPTAQQDRQSTSDTSGDAGVGVGVVESILQLSPASHRHSKGRQLVSILRRADSLLALLETLAIATSRDYFSHPKVHTLL